MADRRRRGSTIDPEFHAFWTTLPQAWKEGLLEALRGGAFEGELKDPLGRGKVRVYFVHPKFAKKVVEAVTAAASAQGGPARVEKGGQDS